MTNFEWLDCMRKEQKGLLQLADALDHGISKPMFYEYVKTQKMDKVGPGIYLSEDGWVDTMYLLHLRFKKAVFSHETALFLHDLSDREPTQYALTVKTGYNPSRMKAEGIQVFTVKEDLMRVGVTTLNTPFGNAVPVYDLERTICDLIRSRSQMEMQTVQTALKLYAARRDKNLRALTNYAKQFHVDNILRQYLGVLL